MTREDAKKILGEGATEEQISNLLNTFHTSMKAKEDENKALKAQLDGRSDYDSLKAQLDEINRAKMTEDERIAAKTKEAEEKLNAANKIFNTAKAKEILSGYNLDEQLIKQIVTSDEASTIANANMFKTQMETFKETIEKNVKDSIAKLDVKPNPTNVPQSDDVMTKEKFDGLTFMQKKEFKDANIDKYHEWYPEH
jgi:hypothetical protein